MNYQSLLIANRGEIAVRIMLTAQSMGIKCIAVYVNDDKDSLHVQLADEAVKIEDNGYLDANAIIEAAKKSNAEAIHPGYGFLSENAKFARKVLKEEIIWVGPSPKVISAMGDKLKAKELAEKAGVPTLPMSENVKNINKLGLPLLIKAAAGGMIFFLSRRLILAGSRAMVRIPLYSSKEGKSISGPKTAIRLLLLAGDRLRLTLAGAGVGVGTLATNGQLVTVTKTAI